MPRPSLAQVAVVAVFALVVAPRASLPLIDGDVWWHIRAGVEVLDTGQIPTRDTWTIAGAGMGWTSQDWLSNVVLAAITGGGAGGGAGATLVSVVYAVLVLLALMLLWMALSARGVSGWLGRLVWLGFGFLVAGPTLGARVQVIDLLLGATALFVLWRYIAHPRRMWLACLPLVAALWANLHAGWVLLFLLGGAVVVGELVDLRFRPAATNPLPGRQLGELAVALGASALAIGLNPSGFGIYAYPLSTALIAAHRDFLAEWSPPSMASIVGQAFWAFVALGVVSALAVARWRLRTADLLILIGLTVMATSAARFLLLVPLAAAVVALAWAQVPSPPVLQRMTRPAGTRYQASANLLLIAGLIGTGAMIALTRVAPNTQVQAIRTHMPVAAVDWMLANSPGQRVFNTYSWGGYLGLRRPELPVYIDGRSDIYGDAPIRRYADAISLRSDPQLLLRDQMIDHVLFNTHHPFAEWLDANGWRRAYSDDLATVWMRGS